MKRQICQLGIGKKKSGFELIQNLKKLRLVPLIFRREPSARALRHTHPLPLLIRPPTAPKYVGFRTLASDCRQSIQLALSGLLLDHRKSAHHTSPLDRARAWIKR